MAESMLGQADEDDGEVRGNETEEKENSVCQIGYVWETGGILTGGVCVGVCVGVGCKEKRI